MNRLLTVFADASWDRRGKQAGGFAYWVRGDGSKRICASGEWPCPNNHEAETVGLCCAILAAINGFETQPGGAIVAQSDSLRALGVLMTLGARPAKTTDHPICENHGSRTSREFAKLAMDAANAAGLKVWLKHIRAHTGIDQPRSFVNEWCDREAKKVRHSCQARLANGVTVEQIKLENSCTPRSQNVSIDSIETHTAPAVPGPTALAAPQERRANGTHDRREHDRLSG